MVGGEVIVLNVPRPDLDALRTTGIHLATWAAFGRHLRGNPLSARVRNNRRCPTETATANVVP